MDGAAGCVAAHRKQLENARRRAQDVATRVEIGSDWGGPGHVTCYGKMLPGPLYDACMCYTIYRVRLLTDRKRESMMDMEAELASCMPDARLA